MALRRLATDLTTRLGLRVAVSDAARLSLASFGARGYASDGYKFAKSHEWVSIEGDTATVGISDHAQKELGDVVFVELPEVDRELKQGDSFGVVESVKAASDVYAPISGTVVEVNEQLSDEPSLVNEDPESSGWIMKLKVADASEADNLLSSEEYKTFASD